MIWAAWVIASATALAWAVDALLDVGAWTPLWCVTGCVVSGTARLLGGRDRARAIGALVTGACVLQWLIHGTGQVLPLFPWEPVTYWPAMAAIVWVIAATWLIRRWPMEGICAAGGAICYTLTIYYPGAVQISLIGVEVLMGLALIAAVTGGGHGRRVDRVYHKSDGGPVGSVADMAMAGLRPVHYPPMALDLQDRK